MATRLVLLAHPDDEMLCLPFLLESGSKEADKDLFLYLTFKSVSQIRQSECQEAIRFLNRKIRESRLVDIDVSLRDGLGWKDVSLDDLNHISNLAQSLGVDSILTFAYEGGHQDHDLAHVVAKFLQRKLGLKLSEFSGYRKHSFLPVFVVSSPKIKMAKMVFPRLKALGIFLSLSAIHKSQFRVWCLLSPPILCKLLLGSHFTTQSDLKGSRKIKENFLYEFRRKARKDLVEDAILRFI